jgi:hypothetical protein
MAIRGPAGGFFLPQQVALKNNVANLIERLGLVAGLAQGFEAFADKRHEDFERCWLGTGQDIAF